MLKLRRTLLGALLTEEGLVTPEQLDVALAEQRRGDGTKRLGEILIQLRFLTEPNLLRVLSIQLDCPIVDLDKEPPDPAVLEIVPSEFAMRHHLIPLRKNDDTLVVAMADPLDISGIDDLHLLTGLDIAPMLALPGEIQRLCEQAYMSRMIQDVKEAERAIEDEDNLDVADLQKMAKEELVIQMVNLIINQAIQDRASDIHVEPFEKELRVRYRVDGVLHEVNSPPKRFHAAVISRIKILADLNIAERRLPQDGRMRIRSSGRQIDLRISTIPTVYGESCVMRILDKQTAMLGLTELGMERGMFGKFRRLIQEPHGIILVTGPTGSGKTTTLYAGLNEIYSVQKKIITVEDPVEYQLNGVNQIQVQPQIGLTFAAGLRSIVRQDPDVIMVGEIRDHETVEISVHAALTGHLVFSTLHTNDAAGAVSRLLDMGAEPFLIASSLIGVVAQRLVRMNCPHCREAYEEKPEVLREIGIDPAMIKREPLMRGKGCAECRGLGYRGRSGIYELLVIDESVRRMVVERASAATVKSYAQKNQGMVSMLADGREKVLQGHTTIAEVLKSASGKISMPEFTYEALDKGGTTTKGTISARDSQEAAVRVRALGVFPTKIADGKSSSNTAARETPTATSADAKTPTSGKKIGRLHILLFTREMADLLDAGLPMDRAFSVLIDQTDSAPLRAMLQAMQGDIRAGQPLSDALQKFPREFPKLYANMVRAGEVSGQLAPVMMRLAEFMEKEQVRRSQIGAALTYPCVLIGIAISAVTFLLTFVIPKLSGIFKDLGSDLPITTRILLALSDIMSHQWWAIILVIAGIVFGFRAWHRTEAGLRTFDNIMLNMPIVGPLTRRIVSARLVRTLGTLLGGGVPILEALEISSSSVGNSAATEAILLARGGVRQGETLHESMSRTDVFLPVVRHMTAVGEETGRLPLMLIRTAETLDFEVDNTMRRMTSLVEPLVVVVMGGFVGFVVLSILLPIFQANSLVK